MGHLNYGEINWPPTASYVGNCTIQSKPGAILWMAEDNIGECAMYAMQVSYPKQSSIGAQGVVNSGNLPAAPTYRIYGPCTNPAIVNPDTALHFEYSTSKGVPAAGVPA